jgi:glycerophosphoryl diester phosphodiesterase
MDRPNSPFFNEKSPILVAHRGGDGAGLEKENSMVAFKTAYLKGYRWFETDVVSTLDGKLVAIHGRGYQLKPNKDLPLRMTVQSLTFNQLKKKHMIGGESVVLLEELLNSFPDVQFLIDPKTGKAARSLSKMLKKRSEDLDRICVGSFILKRNWQIAWSVKRATGKSVHTSLLGPWSAWPIYLGFKFKLLRPFAIKYIKKSGAGSVHIPYSWVLIPLEQAKQFVEYIHSLELKLAVYTPNREEYINAALKAGVDAIMSDKIDLLKSLAEQKHKGKKA